MNITKIQNKLTHLCNTIKPVRVPFKRVKEKTLENQYTDYGRLQRILSLYKSINNNIGCKYLKNLPNLNMLISLLLLTTLVSGITSEYVPCNENKSEDEKPEDPR